MRRYRHNGRLRGLRETVGEIIGCEYEMRTSIATTPVLFYVFATMIIAI